MKKIYKYQMGPLDPISTMKVDLPLGAQILSTGPQGGSIMNPRFVLWALVNPGEEKLKQHEFRILGTGMEIKEPRFRFLGTHHVEMFVWHIFEVLR